MTINNFVQFVEIVQKYNLQHAEKLMNYYNDYAKICNCKPTLKSLYYGKTEKLYAEYINSNNQYIKEKIGSLTMNDPILVFKSNGKILYTINFN